MSLDGYTTCQHRALLKLTISDGIKVPECAACAATVWTAYLLCAHEGHIHRSAPNSHQVTAASTQRHMSVVCADAGV